MNRKILLRGVTAATLIVAWSPSQAQESLPDLDVGANTGPR